MFGRISSSSVAMATSAHQIYSDIFNIFFFFLETRQKLGHGPSVVSVLRSSSAPLGSCRVQGSIPDSLDKSSV